MKEINIAELLKYCPKGMELYSTIFGTVYFEGVRDTGHAVQIDVKTVCNIDMQFYPDGKFNTYYTDSEMTLFPSKDVRTWEGIEAPFKDGDIVSTDDGIFTAIVGKAAVCEVKDLYNHDEKYDTYCHIYYEEDDDKAYFIADDTHLRFDRLANEEEKERLFQAIKEHGYKWDAENKILEMLVPNKFDITNFKPFDKVLVRDNDEQLWTADFFGCHRKTLYPFMCVGHYTTQCIPYEGNEHLLGTTENCDEYYKIWE